MKKMRFLSVVMAFIMLFGMIMGGQAVSAASLVGEFWFESGTITGYDGAGGAVEIPSTIGGVNVTAIGAEAFRDKSAITSISIPDSVTSIGRSAFFQCFGLKSISVPVQATTVAAYTYQYCTSVESITIPEGVKSIEDLAFFGCKNTESVVIPSTVESIGDDAFSADSNPVPKLSQAFFTGDAPALGIADAAATDIGVFKIVDADFKIYYPNNKAGYTDAWSKRASGSESSGCTLVAYDPAAEYTVTYYGNGSTLGSVPVDSVSYKTTNVVTAADSTLTKGNYTFNRWNTMPDGTGLSYEPGDQFIMGAESVKLYAQWPREYKISKGTIAHGSITVKDGDGVEIDTLDESDFGKTTPVLTVTLTPENGYRYKPETLKYNNGTNDFKISYNFKSLKYTFEMPECDITITAEFEPAANDYSMDDASGTLLKYYGKGGNVTIPSQINGVVVKSIGEIAFMSCDELTGITVPEGVTSIGMRAFTDCTSLVGVTLPDSLTKILEGAFFNCAKLESIIIPSKVGTLGDYAFGKCCNLISAYFKGNAPSTVGSFIFNNANAAFKIYYKTGMTGFTNPWKGYTTNVGYIVSVGALSGGSIAPSPVTTGAGAVISLTI
ncbi:MAG: leucine-rich repeat protein, partial [Clostridiaceae bacterium]